MEDGTLLAYGSGVPPHWCRTAPAAEAWALRTALMHCPFIPALRTDCLGLLSAAEAGTLHTTAASRPLARVWKAIAMVVDGETDQLVRGHRLVWVPAHQTTAAIGTRTFSNNTEMTTLDWRANRLADGLAKLAAASNRAPKQLIRLLKSATHACRHAAALLGVVTFTANRCPVTVRREDGTTSTVLKRDARQPPAHSRSRKARALRSQHVLPPQKELGEVATCSLTSCCRARAGKRRAEAFHALSSRRCKAARIGRLRHEARESAATARAVQMIGDGASAPVEVQSAQQRLQRVLASVRAREAVLGVLH